MKIHEDNHIVIMAQFSLVYIYNLMHVHTYVITAQVTQYDTEKKWSYESSFSLFSFQRECF